MLRSRGSRPRGSRKQQTIFFFFRTAFLRTELFDVRFSYKCCNLTSGCLPVKMAFKTVMNKVYYGQCENSELYVLLMLPAQLMHPL